MYAAHVAAALAIKAIRPKAPVWALVGAAFLPDLLWLALAMGGVENVDAATWFDGWSHSMLSLLLQAAACTALAWRRDRGVALAIGAAVASHLLLDLPMHPARLQLYPHASIAFGNVLHGWAGVPGWLGRSNGWWTEALVAAALLAVYALGSRRARIRPNIVAASALFVLSLQCVYG
jgi:hypothetical protein